MTQIWICVIRVYLRLTTFVLQGGADCARIAEQCLTPNLYTIAHWNLARTSSPTSLLVLINRAFYVTGSLLTPVYWPSFKGGRNV
jgi:hypothetical protein